MLYAVNEPLLSHVSLLPLCIRHPPFPPFLQTLRLASFCPSDPPFPNFPLHGAAGSDRHSGLDASFFCTLFCPRLSRAQKGTPTVAGSMQYPPLPLPAPAPPGRPETALKCRLLASRFLGLPASLSTRIESSLLSGKLGIFSSGKLFGYVSRRKSAASGHIYKHKLLSLGHIYKQNTTPFGYISKQKTAVCGHIYKQETNIFLSEKIDMF